MRALLAFTLFGVCAFGQTRTTNLSLAISAECALTGVTTTSSSSTEGAQSVVNGITRFTYLLRTSKSDGGGEIRLQFPAAQAGVDATFSYTTTLNGTGNSLSGTNLVVSIPFLVANFGGNAHTTRMGASAAIEWTSRAPLGVSLQSPTLSINCR